MTTAPYATLAEAAAACAADSGCYAVFDSGCDSEGDFTLCRSANTVYPSDTSCVYVKP